jgi:predicted nucleic acid-binding protein
MANDLYVPDANVFLEYIYDRPLRNCSKQILQDAILSKIQIIVPSLLLDEITEVLCGNVNNLDEVQGHLRYLETLAKQEVLHIVIPNSAVRMKAIEIARTGNPKSGYPEITDCLYHALAILNDAVFITNDKKHISKVQSYGHIEQLSKYG